MSAARPRARARNAIRRSPSTSTLFVVLASPDAGARVARDQRVLPSPPLPSTPPTPGAFRRRTAPRSPQPQERDGGCSLALAPPPGGFERTTRRIRGCTDHARRRPTIASSHSPMGRRGGTRVARGPWEQAGASRRSVRGRTSEYSATPSGRSFRAPLPERKRPDVCVGWGWLGVATCGREGAHPGSFMPGSPGPRHAMHHARLPGSGAAGAGGNGYVAPAMVPGGEWSGVGWGRTPGAAM
jgi:hypothetical protein